MKYSIKDYWRFTRRLFCFNSSIYRRIRSIQQLYWWKPESFSMSLTLNVQLDLPVNMSIDRHFTPVLPKLIFLKKDQKSNVTLLSFHLWLDCSCQHSINADADFSPCSCVLSFEIDAIFFNETAKKICTIWINLETLN